MKIDALMTEKRSQEVASVLISDTLQTIAQKLIDLRIGALIVRDRDDCLMGIVSERDLLPFVAASKALACETPVAKIMTREVITCKPDDEISYVLRLMNANAIRHIPVVEGTKLVAMISIRELTSAYELLQKEADTDALTELSNRRPFLRMLELEFARSKRFKHPFTVAMIDIDHFKVVNDTYGHDAGDQVLRAVAAMLVNEFRTIDLVGRLGGEEFAIIFPETDVKSAKTACERLLKTIANSVIPLSGQQIGVTVSIGLAGASATTLAGAGVLKSADEYLYDAKRNGRNCIVAPLEHAAAHE